MDNCFNSALAVYRNITTTTSTRNRKQKVAAIRRAIIKLTNDENTDVVRNKVRASLPELQRLVLTYTRVTCLSEEDIRILNDLSRYLNGEVGD